MGIEYSQETLKLEGSENAHSTEIIKQGEASQATATVTTRQTFDELELLAEGETTSPQAQGMNSTTDIAHFGTKNFTLFEKQFIVKTGSFQPKGPFPKQTEGTNKGRSFSEYFYKQKTKSGLSLQSLWLSYSILADKCYCTPCWLLSTTPNQAWTEGSKNLSRNIEKHENSEALFVCLFAVLRHISTTWAISARRSSKKEYNTLRAHTGACEVYHTWNNDATVQTD